MVDSSLFLLENEKGKVNHQISPYVGGDKTTNTTLDGEKDGARPLNRIFYASHSYFD